jgi:hypothetical protein
LSTPSLFQCKKAKAKSLCCEFGTASFASGITDSTWKNILIHSIPMNIVGQMHFFAYEYPEAKNLIPRDIKSCSLPPRIQDPANISLITLMESSDKQAIAALLVPPLISFCLRYNK